MGPLGYLHRVEGGCYEKYQEWGLISSKVYLLKLKMSNSTLKCLNISRLLLYILLSCDIPTLIPNVSNNDQTQRNFINKGNSAFDLVACNFWVGSQRVRRGVCKRE